MEPAVSAPWPGPSSPALLVPTADRHQYDQFSEDVTRTACPLLTPRTATAVVEGLTDAGENIVVVGGGDSSAALTAAALETKHHVADATDEENPDVSVTINIVP